jgi:hypothetical protein
MTVHFLKRDFLDFSHWWSLLTVLTILCLGLPYILWHDASPGILALFYSYVMFGIMPQATMLGSLWRNQHLLSRHYLLSLPLAHRQLFRILELRLLVFWLPLLFLAGSMLFTLLPSHDFSPSEVKISTIYLVGLLVSVGLLVHDGIWGALEMERISGYLAKGYRVRAYLRLYAVTFVPYIIASAGWASVLALDHGFALPFSGGRSWFILTEQDAPWFFLAGLLMLVFLRWHNRRRWCVTLG